MGLQVRVRHALGERVLDLPDRTVDNPLAVGRAAGSDVQVPSVSVAPKHCVLFIHDGHWAVQDVGGTTGTYLNGEHIDAPALLQIGDVIQVGTEAAAPTIEVDPGAAAEGRTGYAGSVEPAADFAAAPAAGYGYAPPAPGYGAPPAYGAPGGGGYAPPAAPAYGQGGYAPAPGYAAPAPQYGAAPGYGAQAHDGGDQVAWQDPNAATGYEAPTPSYTRRPKKQDNSAMIMVMVLVAVVIIGGTIWAVSRKKAEPAVVKPPPKVEVERNKGPRNIFTNPGGSGGGSSSGGTAGSGNTEVAIGSQPKLRNPNDIAAAYTNPKGTPANAADTTAKPAGRPKPTERDPDEMKPNVADNSADAEKPKPAAPAPEKVASADPPPERPGPSAEEKIEKNVPQNTGAGDDFAAMEDLDQTPTEPALGVLRLNDFKKRNPNVNPDKIEQFIDRKMDRIWWERVEQLFKRRDALTAAKQQKQMELFDENNPEFKKKLIDEMKQIDKDVKKVTDILREEMKYTAEQPPDLTNKQQLAGLADARDKAAYEKWKKDTMAFLLANHGKLKWTGE